MGVNGTMESSTLKKIQKRAQNYDATLRADDKRFQRSVTMIHEDGTTLNFQSAFLMTVDQEWIVVFTEHHSYHVYHKEDLAGAWQSKRIDKIEALL